MADAAWIEVTRYSRTSDELKVVAVAESSLATIEDWERLDQPSDPRVVNGVKTLITLTNGSQLFIVETRDDLNDLLKIKRK